MENHDTGDRAPPSSDAELPADGSAQERPEKSNAFARVDDQAREATRRYVERVDRYVARPDVLRAGSAAAPSFGHTSRDSERR